MPTPTVITDLSTTAASNAPSGSDSPAVVDDFLRVQGAFIAQLRTGAVATTANITAGTIAGSTVNSTTIGATTPSTGAFTTLSASSTVSGAGFTSRFSAPGPVGDVTPSTGAFTTLSASGAATIQNGITVGSSGATDGVVLFKRSSDGLTVGTISADSANSQFDISTAYSFVQISTDTGEKGLFSNTGLAVTGTGSYTGNLTLSATDGILTGGTSAGRVIVRNADATTYGVFYGATHATQANTITFVTNGSNVTTLDAAGNFGLGVPPSATQVAGDKVIELGAAGCGLNSNASAVMVVTANTWEKSGTGWVYGATAAASKYQQYQGAHTWYTAPSGTAGNPITFTQSLAFGKGTTLALEGATTAAGTGIAFPATQLASSNANTLDDYEEGAWTPTIIGDGAAGVGTYTTQTGAYTKVGRMVMMTGSVVITAHTGSGAMILAGLPFSMTLNSGFVSQITNLTLTAGYVPTFFQQGGANIYIAGTPSGGGTTSAAAIDTAFGIQFTLIGYI